MLNLCPIAAMIGWEKGVIPREVSDLMVNALVWGLSKISLNQCWLSAGILHFYCKKQRQKAISEQVFMIFGHCQNHQN